MQSDILTKMENAVKATLQEFGLHQDTQADCAKRQEPTVNTPVANILGQTLLNSKQKIPESPKKAQEAKAARSKQPKGKFDQAKLDLKEKQLQVYNQLQEQMTLILL